MGGVEEILSKFKQFGMTSYMLKILLITSGFLTSLAKCEVNRFLITLPF
jgi:hypothetical protein